MTTQTKVEFADRGRVKAVTLADRGGSPAIIDLSISAEDTTEPSRNISLTENEAGAIVDAIKEHFK